jgi:hypothetical protein
MTDIAAQVLNLPREKFGEQHQYNDIIGGYVLGCRDAAALLTSSPELAEMVRDKQRLDAITNRDIIETIDFMGTTAHYWTVETPKGELFTTAGDEMSLRDCIDAAIDAALSKEQA